MKKPSVIIDTLLTFAAAFLLGATLCGYFSRNTAVILCGALVFALAVTFFSAKLSDKRKLPAKRKKKLNEILDKFIFSLPEYAYDFALETIRRKCNPKEINGLIIANSTAFSVRITPEKINCATLACDYANAAKAGAKRLVIMSAYGADASAATTGDLLSSPKTEIWEFEKVYDFFTRLGNRPTQTLVLAPRKKKIGAVFKNALSRVNARKYLFTAIVILFFARFMPYSVFYVAIASVSFTLALLSRFEIVSKIQSKMR